MGKIAGGVVAFQFSLARSAESDGENQPPEGELSILSCEISEGKLDINKQAAMTFNSLLRDQ